MSTRPSETPGQRPPGRLAGLIVPPDFYPERQVDAGTWAEAIFEPAALIGAVICFAIGIVQFGLALSPGWPTRFLVPLAVVVGIEAFVYSRRLARSTIMLKEWLVLLVPVVVLVKLLRYVDDPSISVAGDVASWWHDPGTFFSLAFLADCFILFVVWWVVFACTQYLNQLRVQPGEILDENDRRLRDLYEDNWRAIDHSAPLVQVGKLFVWGGVILVLLSSLAAIGADQLFNLSAIAQIVGFQRPSLQLVQANVLLYFVLGLLLLGEMHFVRQRTLWRLDRLAMPAEVPGRWVAGVVGLVVVAAAIAMVLPTSYAMTLGDLIGTVIYAISEVFLFVAAVIFYGIYLIASLFGGGSHGETGPSAPTLPPRLPPAAAPPAGPSPLDTVRSIVFWLIAVGLVVYSLSVLYRRRGPWLNQLPLARVLLTPWRVIRALLGFLARLGRDVGQAVATAVPRIFRRPLPVPPAPFRFIALSRLGPRELVEYFYLSVCERATQLGHPRPPGMTPVEYREVLRERLPLVDPELDAVTTAFLEARYGPRPTTPQGARAIRPVWEALRNKLRGARISRIRERRRT